MLNDFQFDELNVLKAHALAPLESRRDMARLGLLHRINVGWAPNVFHQLIYRSDTLRFPRDLRGCNLRHPYQLHDPMDGTQSRMYQRSIFGLIYTYNLLPGSLLVARNIGEFQRRLQRGLRHAAATGVDQWHALLKWCAQDDSRSFPTYIRPLNIFQLTGSSRVVFFTRV